MVTNAIPKADFPGTSARLTLSSFFGEQPQCGLPSFLVSFSRVLPELWYNLEERGRLWELHQAHCVLSSNTDSMALLRSLSNL